MVSVAFLRGMNLGGRRITNEALCAAFRDLGFRDVSSYRASGNVIFAHDAIGEDALADRIEAGLRAALGYPVPTYLRTADAVRAIAAFTPFPDAPPGRGKLQVTLLREAPEVSVERFATDDDRLLLHGRELYWLPRGGTIEAALDVAAVERAVGVGTMRTHGTITGIAGRLGAAGTQG